MKTITTLSLHIEKVTTVEEIDDGDVHAAYAGGYDDGYEAATQDTQKAPGVNHASVDGPQQTAPFQPTEPHAGPYIWFGNMPGIGSQG